MRPSFLMLLGLLAAAAFGQDRPRRVFADNCMNCHLPPDPAFPTDSAWLGEIKGTA